MGYTVSFIADVKIKAGGLGGLLRHDARDVDRENGEEVQHANKAIDPARTAENETLVSDGEGGFKPCTSRAEIEAALEARLKAVKKPLRSNAVVLRPCIVQLDPEWYKVHQNEEERAEAVNALSEWVCDTFGAENVIYMSLHNDEGSPHLHVGFCPVTDDGRLNQKEWFKSPETLREMHQSLRQHMADQGYEVDMQNRKPGKHAKRMSVSEYKDFAQLQDERKDFEAKRKAFEAEKARAVSAFQRVLEGGKKLELDKQAFEAEKAAFEAFREATEAEIEAERAKAFEAVGEAKRNALEALSEAAPGILEAARIAASEARKAEKLTEAEAKKRFAREAIDKARQTGAEVFGRSLRMPRSFERDIC